MRRVDPAYGIIFATDGATAAAGAFNAAWLGGRWLGTVSRGRRLAALSLAVLNGGIAVQAVFEQALFSAHRFGLTTAPFFASGAWLASRLPLLAGTLLLAMLILRRRP